jgi:hypothetical protein
VEIQKIIQLYIIEDSLDARICLFLISNEAVGIASVVRLAVMESIILMPLILWLARCSLARCDLLVAVELETLTLDFCNYQPKWACRFCFHFVGLTTAFFEFYTPIWVGISLASIAVESVATFQILGKKSIP